MALAQGTVTNNSGIDPGTGTYLTEIDKVTASVHIEAIDGDGHFQEAKKLREEISHTLRGYGDPTAAPGLNSLTEIDDGPFIDSVETEDSGEEFDQFVVEGSEFGT